MLRPASDEDVHGGIIEGLRLRQPDLDVLRVQDTGLSRTPDPDILAWAATHGRVMLTADLNTMVGFAWARVKAGQPMPGLLALREPIQIGPAIDDILLVAVCYGADEINGQVLFIPL